MRIKYTMDGTTFVEDVVSFTWRAAAIEFKSQYFDSVAAGFDRAEDTRDVGNSLLYNNYADIDNYKTTIIIDNQSHKHRLTPISTLEFAGYKDWFARLCLSEALDVYKCDKLFAYAIAFNDFDYFKTIPIANLRFLTEYYTKYDKRNRDKETLNHALKIGELYNELDSVEKTLLYNRVPEFVEQIGTDDLLELGANILAVIVEYIERKDFCNMKVGMHQSFDGLSNCIADAEAYDFNTFQVFIRNNRNMQMRTFTSESYSTFNAAWRKSSIESYVVHAPYAMNPASGDTDILSRTKKMIEADLYVLNNMAGEKHYVLHPGAYTEYTSQSAMRTLCDTLHELEPFMKNVHIAVEIMAGQGSQIMCETGQLYLFLTECKDLPMVELCLDTCHMYGAGLTVEIVEAILNLADARDRVGVIHVNDSKCPFKSYKDRHANIGAGHIGEEQLRSDVTRLSALNPNAPIILETPAELELQDTLLVKSWFE